MRATTMHCKGLLLTTALVFASFFNPASAADVCPSAGQKQMILIRLYFGEHIGGRNFVSPRAWRNFLSDAVTSRFPDGFTVYDASGQWTNPNTRKILHEPSKIVEIATDDTKDLAARIDGIANDYRVRFHQRSIGIVTMRACASF